MFTCLKVQRRVCEGVRRELLRRLSQREENRADDKTYSDPDNGAEQRLTVRNAEIQLVPRGRFYLLDLFPGKEKQSWSWNLAKQTFN